MTEEEAKTKWCVHTNAAENPSKCDGSACMGWRWDMEWESAIEEGQGCDLVVRLKPLKGKPRMGWCGLAGKP